MEIEIKKTTYGKDRLIVTNGENIVFLYIEDGGKDTVIFTALGEDEKIFMRKNPLND